MPFMKETTDHRWVFQSMAQSVDDNFAVNVNNIFTNCQVVNDLRVTCVTSL